MTKSTPLRYFFAEIALDDCPRFYGCISVFHLAVTLFYAPSDICGAGGMYRECIHSTPVGHSEYLRYDTVFIETDRDLPGMEGLVVGCVFLFFSFTFQDVHYPCALIHWYSSVGLEPDEETGLWVVKPDFEANGSRSLAVVHLESISWGAHLIGVYGSSFLPERVHFANSLELFHAYCDDRNSDYKTISSVFP